MDGRVVRRWDKAAVNCLTGSFAALATSMGRPVDERTLFEQGGGYLFEASVDPGGRPSYTFPVQEVGSEGMRRLGFLIDGIPIEADRFADQLAELLTLFGAVVVWVNTAHLTYAEGYRNMPPYLHAVVVREISADRGRIGVWDCLVLERQPFGCHAHMDVADLGRAATTHFDGRDSYGMGYCYVATDTGAPASNDPEPASLAALLAGQAGQFAAEERFHGALRRYRARCVEALADTATVPDIARHVFQQSTVLYAVPSLLLMARSLAAAEIFAPVATLHETALRHWRAVGVLAMRYAAAPNPSVLGRLVARLDELHKVTTGLWAAVGDASGTGRARSSGNRKGGPTT